MYISRKLFVLIEIKQKISLGASSVDINFTPYGKYQNYISDMFK